MHQQSFYHLILSILLLAAVFQTHQLQAQQDTFYYNFHDWETLPNPPVQFIYNRSNSSFLNGRLTEYYESGQPKAHGELSNGWRTASWKTWAEDGTLLHQRNYAHPLSYIIEQPEPPGKGPAALFNTHFSIKREKGLIAYQEVEEYEVFWQKQLWLDLTPDNNPLLFEKNRLLNHLLNALDNEKPPTVYDGNNDKFREPVSLENAKWLLSREKENIIGIRLKSVWFFNNLTQCMNRRILGLAFLYETTPGSTQPLVWFYYPEIRSLLAEIPVSATSSSFPIQQLEDHFHFWEFNGQIIKESNVHDRYINEYLTDEKDQLEEHFRILLDIYSFEHDAWQLFNQGQSVLDRY